MKKPKYTYLRCYPVFVHYLEHQAGLRLGSTRRPGELVKRLLSGRLRGRRPSRENQRFFGLDKRRQVFRAVLTRRERERLERAQSAFTFSTVLTPIEALIREHALERGFWIEAHPTCDKWCPADCPGKKAKV